MPSAPGFDGLSIAGGAHVHNTPAHTSPASAISRLDCKILGNILFLASGDDEFCRKDSLDSRRDVARRTAQVNRQWRMAALENKYIWLGPILSLSWYSSLDWIQIILIRSQPLSLDLVIPSDIKRDICSYIIMMIRKEHRIRSLEINLNPIPDSWVFEAKTPPGRIVAGRPPLYVVDNMNTARLHPSPHSARPLSVVHKMFPSNALRNLSLGQECFIPVVLLLDGLRNMENLETLRIHHLSEGPPSGTLVDLPEVPTVKMLNLNLKELSVTASISTCASVLKNISLPPSCSIQLECHNATICPYLDEVLLKIKQALYSWRCETDSESNGRQSLRMGATHIGFSLEGPKDDEISSYTSNHPYLNLSLDWRRSKTPLDNLVLLLPFLLSTFQTSHNSPTTLTIDADDKVAITRATRAPILNWLMDTPIIQALDFKTYEAFVLLEPLFRLRNRSHATTNKILPTLCDLTFRDVTYSSNLDKSWRRLVRGLQRRQRARRPVTHIEFINCFAQSELDGTSDTLEEMIKMVSPFVEEIFIDGEEVDYDAPDDDEEETNYDTDSTVHQDSDIEL